MLVNFADSVALIANETIKQTRKLILIFLYLILNAQPEMFRKMTTTPAKIV